MGAKVTLCGPPTLIPRGIEALGCEVSYDLDGLGEADVVYALRMQRERMSESFVPSLREYAARYQIDSRRLGPRQLLMHPGPVNRGVELSPEVIDSPQSLITAQVESGLVVRMAILYELLAGSDRARPERGSAPADTRRSDSRRERRGERIRGSRRAPKLIARPGPGANLVIRGARLFDPRAGLDATRDLVVRDGEIAEIAEPGERARDRGRGDRRRRGAARAARPSSTPTSTSASPARSTRRTSRRAPAPPPPAATAR